jgi:hypothetical protein
MKYRTEKEGDMLRIYAVKSFGNVKEGDMGGLIKTEWNLSHKGNSWVYINARVEGNSRVTGNGRVGGHACVTDNVLVAGAACVGGHARVGGNARVSGSIT